VAAGLSVANVYYAQPLLDVMARDLGIASAVIGLVVTLTQVGYALGLIFIVPLGDLVDRRRLIVSQTLLSVAALAVVAMARTASMLLFGMMATGLLAVVVQVLVAFAASLTDPNERGKVVGTVTSGVVIGILAARFLAGLLSDLRLACGIPHLGHPDADRGRVAPESPAAPAFTGKCRELRNCVAIGPHAVSP
jgi:predicted MFS family arabinose efflux permease